MMTSDNAIIAREGKPGECGRNVIIKVTVTRQKAIVRPESGGDGYNRNRYFYGYGFTA